MATNGWSGRRSGRRGLWPRAATALWRAAIYSSALCFALTREEQQRSGFQYQYSVFQLELSRNLLFARGGTMDEVYQKLIDRTRQPLELEHLKTIFGFRHRPRQKLKRGRPGPEVAKEVQAHGYDLTVFKVRWGNLTLKIYDKGGRVLRVEVVVHNAKELRCGKVLQKLPVLLERMSGMLVRFLNTVQVAHVSFLDQGAFERWAQPSTRGTRRLAGIDLNKARNRHVVDAGLGLAMHRGGSAWRNWPRPYERAPIGGPKGIRSAKRRMIWP